MGALSREIRGFLYAFLLYIHDKKAKNNANILKIYEIICKYQKIVVSLHCNSKQQSLTIKKLTL